MTTNIRAKLIEELKKKPLSVNEAKRILDIDWRTANNNFENLKESGNVFEKQEKNKRIFYLREQGNYFNIPLETKTKQKLQSYYSYIKKVMNEQGETPRKTKIYKLVYLLNKNNNLEFPVFWYKYGPCLLVDTDTSQPIIELKKEEKDNIDKIVKQYKEVKLTNIIKKVYQDNPVYNTLLTLDNNEEKYKDLIRAVPLEAKKIVIEYSDVMLFLNKNNDFQPRINMLKDYFLNYIANLFAHNDLKMIKPYYAEYTEHRLRNAEEEIMTLLEETKKEFKIEGMISKDLDMDLIQQFTDSLKNLKEGNFKRIS